MVIVHVFGMLLDVSQPWARSWDPVLLCEVDDLDPWQHPERCDPSGGGCSSTASCDHNAVGGWVRNIAALVAVHIHPPPNLGVQLCWWRISFCREAYELHWITKYYPSTVVGMARCLNLPSISVRPSKHLKQTEESPSRQAVKPRPRTPWATVNLV